MYHRKNARHLLLFIFFRISKTSLTQTSEIPRKVKKNAEFRKWNCPQNKVQRPKFCTFLLNKFWTIFTNFYNKLEFYTIPKKCVRLISLWLRLYDKRSLNHKRKIKENIFSKRRWYMRKHSKDDSDKDIIFHSSENQNERISVRDGGTLTINGIKQSDAGTYICEVSNSEGNQQLEIHLSVIGALTAHIQPALQTVNLGKSTELVRAFVQ